MLNYVSTYRGSLQIELDSCIFASMLSAVGCFVKDTIGMVDEKERAGGLNILGYNDYKILIEEKKGLYLASVTKGNLSELLINDMRDILSEVQKTYGKILADWDGDLDKVTDTESIISRLITSGKYSGKFLVDDPKIQQENLFDNILLGIQRVSEERPLILFLDDLQWSDPSSLALFHYLARNTRDNRVLILGTYRPEDIIEARDGRTHHLETAMQNMNREDLFEKIELKRLGQEDTGMIINSALGNTSFDDIFLKKIYKETGGTPFFIIEVVKLLMEDGSISPTEEGVWELKAELEELDVPSKVYDVIKRRLDRLIKEQRDILECASVVGEEFSSGVVANTMGLNIIQLLKNLSEIEKSHKLIHSYEKKYVFDHAKIREILYNGIMVELKQEYHKIVADTIAEIHMDNLDEVINELAYHYYKAGAKRAVEYLVKAGDMAKDRYANEEAIRFYNNAIKILGSEANTEILEKLADILILIGDFNKAIENFNKAKESAVDNEAKARNLRKIGNIYVKKGEFDKSLELLADAKEIVEKGTAEHGIILLEEGYPYERKGDYEKAMPLFLEAVKVSEKAGGDQRDIGNALRAVGNIYLSKGDYNYALQFYEKSLAVMEKIGDKRGIAAALNNIGITYKDKGEMDKALEFYERCLEIVEKIGDKWGIATSLNNIGLLYHGKGEVTKSLEFHERSLEIEEKIGDKRGIAISLNNIASVYVYRGELDRALKFHERGLEIKEKIGDKPGIAMSLNNIGEMCWHKGEMDRALEYYGRSLEIYLEIGGKRESIHNYCGLAEVERERGNVKDALENAEKALGIAVDIGAKSEVAMSHRVLGMVYREKKDWEKAKEEFGKAKEILGDFVNKKEFAHLSYQLALLNKAMDEPDKASEHLEHAVSEFERMGMKLWAEKCRNAL